MSARSDALRAVATSCPRCAARRETGQRYCLECGLGLPALGGALAAGRRVWIARLGWYPGDFVWLTLAAAVVAGAGAAASISLAGSRPGAHPGTVVARRPAAVSTPAHAQLNGSLQWPRAQRGWTTVIASVPVSRGTSHALAVAKRAAHDGLPQVGVLVSSAYASLQPGYFVVFSGIYGARRDAQTALRSVRARGFSGAFSRRIAP